MKNQLLEESNSLFINKTEFLRINFSEEFRNKLSLRAQEQKCLEGDIIYSTIRSHKKNLNLEDPESSVYLYYIIKG